MGFRDPTLRDIVRAPASLPAHGMRASLLAARLVIILLSPLPAQSPGSLALGLVRRALLTGVPTLHALLDCLRAQVPSQALGHGCPQSLSHLVSGPDFPTSTWYVTPHLQDTSWGGRGKDRGGEASQGKEEKRGTRDAQTNRNRGERGSGGGGEREKEGGGERERGRGDRE